MCRRRKLNGSGADAHSGDKGEDEDMGSQDDKGERTHFGLKSC